MKIAKLDDGIPGGNRNAAKTVFLVFLTSVK